MGGIGAMGACLFASHQKTNSSCSPHLQKAFFSVSRHLHSLLSSKTLWVFHFHEDADLPRFFCFVLFGFFFFLGSPGAGLFPSALGSLKKHGSASFLLPSTRICCQSPFSFHRHLLAGSSVSVSLLCGHFRRSCVSHECFFQSIHINRDSLSVHTLCPAHTSSVPFPSAHNPNGV